MTDTRPPGDRRSRLAPEVRRAQIVDAAAAVVLEQGYLPLPMERLAQAAGVSKALVYAYFPTQHDLANAVLARQFRGLIDAGIEQASLAAPLEDAACAVALIYFAEVARSGPLVHVILRDHFMSGQLDPAVAALRDRVVRNLARAARRTLQLSAREAVAATNMIITIPEQAGRLAYTGEMQIDRAQGLCTQLVRSSVQALAPRDL